MRHYLDDARRDLGTDPDADEIARDLESAIGDRLTGRNEPVTGSHRVRRPVDIRVGGPVVPAAGRSHQDLGMDKHTGMAAMIRSTLWDLGLPTATYYALHLAGVGDAAALMAGTGAAGVRLAVVAVRSRRLSPFSLLMGAVFGVGLLFTLLTATRG
jgi:hypothetical protein